MPVNPNTFCIGPWSEIRIMADGELSYCHTAQLPLNGPNPSDNITQTRLDDYFFGQSIKSIRNTLINGGCVDTCSNCYNDENVTDFSYRHRRNQQMAIFPGKHFNKSFRESNMLARIDNNNIKPLFYNVLLSNLCNLGCIMCNERFSSRLAVDFQKIGIHRDIRKGPASLDWTQNSVAWNDFVTHVINNEQAVCVHFQGGEPMLHEKYIEFLDRCIAANRTDFHHTVVTNGTIYNAEIINKVKKFKSFQVEISIDGITPVNDYVRYPSKTVNIIENIHKYLAHRDDNFDVVIRTVPQLLTVYNYVDLLEFALENEIIIDSNIINEPFYLAPNLLHSSAIEKIKQDLTQFISRVDEKQEKYNPRNIRNRQFFRQALVSNAQLIINSLAQPPGINHAQLKQQARDFFKDMDRIRKINLLDYCDFMKEF